VVLLVKTKAFRCIGTCSKVSSNLDLTTILTESSGTLWHAERNGVSKRHADWLCAEPFKTRPLASVAVTCEGGYRRERERERQSDWIWLADEGTWLNSQNRLKLGHLCMCQPQGASTTNHFTFREREVWTICFFRDLNSFRCYSASVTSLKPRYHSNFYNELLLSALNISSVPGSNVEQTLPTREERLLLSSV
jgi:hypothetical protein